MKKCWFTCYASAGRGDGNTWDLDFDLSENEYERIIPLYERGIDLIDYYEEIKDIFDRLYEEMMDLEVETVLGDLERGWIDVEDIIDYCPDANVNNITPKQVRDYLESKYRYGIRFSDKLTK